MAKKEKLQEKCIGALRSLVIDMTNTANSGHPGMALDVAPSVYALFHDHLVASPSDPAWINRDRFVLSSGHVSSLLYANLHLCGYDLSMEDLKQFRKLGSRTPGHPEYGWTAGVDATSGPLGQGIAQAVGMAIAEESIRARYPHSGDVFGHYTYCLCGDGCLQEGIAQEAISLAGHHHLGKLILIYDANGATLDGPTDDSLSENIEHRFLACEWNVLRVEDGNDYAAVSRALAKAKKSKDPTLIIVKSIIGFGSKNQGSHKTHGSPLGVEDGAFAKANYGYDYPEFTVPSEVYESYKENFVARGEEAHRRFLEAKEAYLQKYPEEANAFFECFDRNVEYGRPAYPEFEIGKAVATRASSGKCLKALHDALPFTFGGSADVAGSTVTNMEGEPMFSFDNRAGRDMHWGIREFAMASCCNGIALHGGLLPYGACFLVFADYLKPALRLSALQELPVFFLFTHDSIAVGEDGPTHQPIEQLAMLRSIPGLEVIRPADAHEVIAAYETIRLKKKGPTALILTRQGVPTLEETSAEEAQKGGYLIFNPKGAKWLLLATGSEVAPALSIAKALTEEGKPVAVASLPSISRFLGQDEKYIKDVLFLPREKRISIEMASTFGWGGLAEHNIGIDRFGASGKDKAVIESLGFDEASLRAKIEAILGRK